MTGPILRTDLARIAELRSALVGERLEDVAYGQSAYAGYADPQDGDIHQVDFALLLRLPSQVITITWARDDRVEGLSTSATEPHYDGDDTVLVPATSTAWAVVIGQTIASVDLGWQISETGVPESLWGLRLGFPGDRRVVVALGEIGPDAAAWYHPDTLVVLFDEKDLTRYRTLGGATPVTGPILFEDAS
ncbi:hypothetical protein GCM10010435_26610 [Winogradskya consettensis]|uniref:Uncharacterized protein n=1 Tax=Winogradskya consettensis TaxID=113560 RepID=A0A919VSS2_9ACTN|nr:hypothetical protein [Actinoplanes consettensis]GIM68134.1 hypothetical protein Aco04nite_09400 [Actinoplanes consettensis]